jgi:hypothetical protein
MLDHGKDVGMGAVEQVDAEEFACEDCVGLEAHELLPAFGTPGSPDPWSSACSVPITAGTDRGDCVGDRQRPSGEPPLPGTTVNGGIV